MTRRVADQADGLRRLLVNGVAAEGEAAQIMANLSSAPAAATLPSRCSLQDRFAPMSICQAGMIGLLDAWNRYRDNRGAQSETFVSQRIRGAMLDELRAIDWGSRGLRASARKVDQAIQRSNIGSAGRRTRARSPRK